MIIGIDASRATKLNKTGVEWYAYHVIENLVKIDSQNNFVLYIKDQPDEWLKKIGERANVKIKRLRWPFKFLWTQKRLSWEMLLNPPDVLFIPASAIPFIHPKNTIVTIHDVGFMAYPQSYDRWQRWYQTWSTRLAIKHAKKIITISEFSKQEIIKYFITPLVPPLGKGGGNSADKIVVTYLGYDKKKFNTDAARNDDVLKKYSITRPYLLFVGRLERKKNIAGLVRAFGGGVTLVLAGRPGYGWSEAEKIIADKNLQKNIIITGYVSEEDLPALYRGATALVFPSFYEGFGLPVLEAFACGTPVICSNAASLPEIAGEAALLVAPDDANAIAEAMERIVINETLRGELTYKGRERLQRFNWQRCGEKTMAILLKVNSDK